MKIRLLSDLHIDVNSDYDISLKDNDVFTLVAGDTSGDPQVTADWIKKNIKKGAFVCGNHLVYNRRGLPIEDLKEELHKEFPLDSNITFFDYDVGVISKDLGDNVLLVADVMYTDYKLKIPKSNPTGLVSKNMSICIPRFSSTYLNDFTYGKTKKATYKKIHSSLSSELFPDDGLYYLRPKFYKDHFNDAFKAIDKIVKSNKDKDIILMTHHCLSTKCISDQFKNNSLNGSYVSNKDLWIKRNPNIKLVLSGHVHHRDIFKVGSCTYVLNPLGYCSSTYKQFNFDTYTFDNTWTPDVFVDTKTWKVDVIPFTNQQFETQWLKDRQKIADSLKFIG